MGDIMDVILQSESSFIGSRTGPYKRARLEKEMGFSALYSMIYYTHIVSNQISQVF